jgi:hypothetical protein
MRLSDARLRRRPTKLIYANHRLPSMAQRRHRPSRSVEPIVRPTAHHPHLRKWILEQCRYTQRARTDVESSQDLRHSEGPTTFPVVASRNIYQCLGVRKQRAQGRLVLASRNSCQIFEIDIRSMQLSASLGAFVKQPLSERPVPLKIE